MTDGTHEAARREPGGARVALGLGLALVVTLILSLPQHVVPPGRDQGIFLYHGARIAEGGVPYRDMWDHKPPGIHYLYALSQRVDARYESVNDLDIAWRLLTLIAIFRLGLRLGGGRAATPAALIYGVWSASIGSMFWFTAQPEGFMVLPMAIAVDAHLRETRAGAALAGVAIAAAVLLKPTAILLLPVLLLDLLGRHHRVARASLIAAGGLLVAASVGAGFVAAGALGDLIDAVFHFNQMHAGVAMPAEWLLRQGGWLFAILLPPAALVVPRLVRPGSDRRTLLVLLGWLLACLAGVLVQRKYFGYHFFAMIGPLALLAGDGLAGLMRRAGASRAPRLARLGLWLVAVAGTVWWLTGHYMGGGLVEPGSPPRRTLAHLGGEAASGDSPFSPRQRYAGVFAQADVSLAQTLAVATYLGQRIEPGDAVLVWGFEPLINYWAGAPAPSRFEFDLPLVVPVASEREERLRAKFRARFLAELEARPPAYVVVARRDENHLEERDSAQQIGEFERLAAFVNRRYRHERTIGDFEVLRRR